MLGIGTHSPSATRTHQTVLRHLEGLRPLVLLQETITVTHLNALPASHRLFRSIVSASREVHNDKLDKQRAKWMPVFIRSPIRQVSGSKC